jgi:hypothetical protein
MQFRQDPRSLEFTAHQRRPNLLPDAGLPSKAKPVEAGLRQYESSLRGTKSSRLLPGSTMAIIVDSDSAMSTTDLTRARIRTCDVGNV